MKTDLNIKEIVAALSRFLHRYHVLIFALFVLGGLSGATFMLYQTATSAQTAETSIPASTFDKATIEKINNLSNATSTNPEPVRPAGRTNPFKE